MALVASFAFAASCATSKPATPSVSDEQIIDEGSRLFSEGKLEEAQGTWSTIPDTEKKNLFIGFVQAYMAFDKSIAKAEEALAESKPELALESAKDAGSPPEAPIEFTNADPLDTRARLARIGDEAGKAIAARAAQTEGAADALLATAKTRVIKDGAQTAAKAMEGFESAARLFEDVSAWVPDANADAARAKDKARAAETLHRTLLKETLLNFPDRMGEVFARSPGAAKKLSDKELLAFNNETATIIQSGLSEFDSIVSAYPDILDAATLDKLRNSARGLSTRFARMEASIKAVKDRGKPVMPLIIGIFNPQPNDPQRSRPASFSGTSIKDSDWWWGIADIPKGTAQDLVISLSDSRIVRVYAVGRGSGGARTAPDLVNPLFKVGNSWPVLNAGERLDNGVFHIEVGPGQSESYSGEAVVYKSFITRTR
jgi:hypothetical protein